MTDQTILAISTSLHQCNLYCTGSMHTDLITVNYELSVQKLTGQLERAIASGDMIGKRVVSVKEVFELPDMVQATSFGALDSGIHSDDLFKPTHGYLVTIEM